MNLKKPNWISGIIHLYNVIVKMVIWSNIDNNQNQNTLMLYIYIYIYIYIYVYIYNKTCTFMN